MLKDDFKIMDLQLFADGDSDDVDDIDDNQDNQDDSDNKDIDIKGLFANEDFLKQFQSELDKRVAQSLKTNDKKWQKKLEDEKKKADMTHEELLAEKEREIKARELKLEKIQYFKDEEIPLDFLDFVSGSDIGEIEENADKLLETFNKEVQKAVEARLKQNPNIPPKGKTKGAITLEDIDNMSPEDINKNWDSISKLLQGK